MTPEEVKAMVDMTTTINLEVYYYWCTAIMILIHAGFMMYEMGASVSYTHLTLPTKA